MHYETAPTHNPLSKSDPTINWFTHVRIILQEKERDAQDFRNPSASWISRARTGETPLGSQTGPAHYVPV